MSYVTYGDVQHRANPLGLVMARYGGGIRLRYRDQLSNARVWTGLTVLHALEIVKDVEANSAPAKP